MFELEQVMLSRRDVNPNMPLLMIVTLSIVFLNAKSSAANRTLAIEDLRPSRYADYPFVYPMTGTIEQGAWRMSCRKPPNDSNFGSNTHAEAGVHTGEDWLVNEISADSQNKSIFAINHGVVVYAGVQQGATGNVVIVRHDAPGDRPFVIPNFPYEGHACGRDEDSTSSVVYSYYLHLDEPLAVNVADQVYKGQRIGQTYAVSDMIANGGNMEYVPHLHLELWSSIKASATDTFNDDDGYAPEGCGSDSFGHSLNKLVEPREFIQRNNAGLMIDTMSEIGSNLGLVVIRGRDFGLTTSPVYVSRFPGSIAELDGTPDTWRYLPLAADRSDAHINMKDELRSTNGARRYGDLELPYRVVLDVGDGNWSNWKHYPFTDVYPFDSFSEDVVEAWDKGLVLGVKGLTCIDARHGGCSFAPEMIIDRAQFLTLVVRALEMHKGEKLEATASVPGPGGFVDAWFYDSLQKAYTYTNSHNQETLGIWSEADLSGLESPWSEPVSREEAAHIIFNALRLGSARAWDFRPPWFVDVPPVDGTRANWIYSSRRHGIMEGFRRDGAIHFEPEKKITRAEAVRALHRAFLVERSWLLSLFD